MYLSALSLALNRPGAVGLTLEQAVAALFANNEQGAWYDPSDYSTMFETAAGASPISTVEKPVGLILDKRKGLVLGSELNDGLGDAANWTALGTNTIGESGDEITVTYVDNAGGATAALSSAAGLSSNLTVGKWYKVTGEAKVNTGSVAIAVSAATTFETAAITSTSFVAFTLYFLASNATTNTLTFTGMGSGEAITVRAISVKLIDGNHAYRTGTTTRPVLRARYNLLTYSEQMDVTAVWVRSQSNMTANAAVAPDGTTTADKLFENTQNAVHNVTQSVTVVANATYTASIYVKAAGGARVSFAILDGTNTNGCRLRANLTSNPPAIYETAAVGTGTYVGSTFTSVGNDWYRVTLTGSHAATTTNLLVTLINASNSNSYLGDGASGFFIWGADLRVGTSAGDYQRIEDAPTAGGGAVTYATTSTITGQPFRPYLFFDGSDDWFVTANINLSSTDKMGVFAGLSKRSDAAAGLLCELSSNYNNNTGTFQVFAAASSPYQYYMGINGGSANAGGVTSGFAAIRNDVLSCTFDIAGAAPADEMKMRINGVSQTLTIVNANLATGNFASNQPLYIGRRNGTDAPSSCHIYGLLLRGVASSAGEVATIESYLAGKTGVTL